MRAECRSVDTVKRILLTQQQGIQQRVTVAVKVLHVIRILVPITCRNQLRRHFDHWQVAFNLC